ncbi:unnamed protein product [Effrenium voratum]|nr:unnamed protein product [Effrenium voratum]
MASMLWVKVEGGESTIRVLRRDLPVADVAALLKNVKEQVGRLPNIGLDRLNLYQNEEVKKRGASAESSLEQIDGGEDDLNPLFVSVPDVPVTTWLKERCFTMLGTCSGDIAVLGRCCVLFCSVATYVLIMVHCYNDVPAFRALLATFVLTGADLLPKICHEAHEDIIDWAFGSLLLLLGLLTESQQLLSEDVSMGLITGAAANIYKKIALLLICTSEFRSAFRTSIMRFFHGSVQGTQGLTAPLLDSV